MTATEDVVPPASAPARILDATHALVLRGGAAQVSTGDVATAAGVSKALVHYHFRDKTTLLVALAERVGAAILTRERRSLGSGASAVDTYWDWLRDELARGDIFVLISLAACDVPDVRAVTRGLAERRRRLALEHVADMFGALALTPRVPLEPLAGAIVAFTDGLATATVLEPERDARPAFDAFWLALLSVCE